MRRGVGCICHVKRCKERAQVDLRAARLHSSSTGAFYELAMTVSAIKQSN